MNTCINEWINEWMKKNKYLHGGGGGDMHMRIIIVQSTENSHEHQPSFQGREARVIHFQSTRRVERFYHIRFQSIIKWKKKTDTKSKSVSKSKFHWYPYRIHWSSIRWTLDRRSGQTSHCGMEARQLRNPGVFKGIGSVGSGDFGGFL